MKPKAISNMGELHVRISKIRQDFCYKNNMEFAKKIGANVSHVSGICSGSKLAGPETLEKILSAFPQVNRSWLYFGEGNMLREEQSAPSSERKDSPSISSVGNGNNNSIHAGMSVDAIISLYEGRLMDKDEQIKLLKDSVKHLANEIEELRSWTKLCAERYLTNMDSIKDVTEDTNEIVRDCRKHIGYIQDKEEKK